MSTFGGGVVSFFEAQAEKPVARTTAARRRSADFIGSCYRVWMFVFVGATEQPI